MSGTDWLVILGLLVIAINIACRQDNVDAVQRGAIGTGSTARWVAAVLAGVAIWAVLMHFGATP